MVVKVQSVKIIFVNYDNWQIFALNIKKKLMFFNVNNCDCHNCIVLLYFLLFGAEVKLREVGTIYVKLVCPNDCLKCDLSCVNDAKYKLLQPATL